MSTDEAIERVIEAVDDMCAIAGKNQGLTSPAVRSVLRTALKELLAAHRCQCNSCQKDDGK